MGFIRFGVSMYLLIETVRVEIVEICVPKENWLRWFNVVAAARRTPVLPYSYELFTSTFKSVCHFFVFFFSPSLENCEYNRRWADSKAARRLVGISKEEKNRIHPTRLFKQQQPFDKNMYVKETIRINDIEYIRRFVFTRCAHYDV